MENTKTLSRVHEGKVFTGVCGGLAEHFNMEVQTVRMVAPNHFEQYWQAGVLSNKTEFEMKKAGKGSAEWLKLRKR